MTFFGITLQTFNNIYFFSFFLILLSILFFRAKKSIYVSKLLNVGSNKFLLNFSNKKLILRFILLSIGTFFLFFSLLSPAWDKKEEEVEQVGRDIFIALDISRSMLAKDMSPDRLEWAKSKIKKLSQVLKNDRIGLILFSEAAFVQCPLTQDTATFYSLLDQADTQIISSGSTSIDQAIKIAIEKFKSKENNKSKLLIIFTDGEDFSSDLAGIKEEAKKQNLSIFTVGSATTQGAQIPLYDQFGKITGFQLDENGNVVNSKLNEGILKALSTSCGGIYIKGSNDNQDINEIVFNVEKFEKEKFDDKKITYLENQYPYFVLISFFCLALEWLL